jgi:hypothetical protein
MVCAYFQSFYQQSDAVAWISWDPQIKRKGGQEAEDWEKISIEGLAETHPVPTSVEEMLNRYITKEVYDHLFGDQFDEEFLRQHGFQILKNSSTSILVHEKIDGWLIKIGQKPTRELLMDSFTQARKASVSEQKNIWLPVLHTNLLRPAGQDFFANHLKKMDKGDQALFNLPHEYLYRSPHAPLNAPLHEQYFAISERRYTHSGDETIALLKEKNLTEQREYARKINAFIIATRFTDFHKNNLLFSRKIPNCFELIDMEPIGIIIDAEDNGMHLFNAEEQVLLGLIAFRDTYCIDNGLTAMALEADQAIVDYLGERPDLKAKVGANTFRLEHLPTTRCQKIRKYALITLSIIIPIIPIIILIWSFFVVNFASTDPLCQYQNIYHSPGVDFATKT